MDIDLKAIASYPVAQALADADPALTLMIPPELRLPHTFGDLPVEAYLAGTEWVDDARDFALVAERFGWVRTRLGDAGLTAIVTYTRDGRPPLYLMASYTEGDVRIEAFADAAGRAKAKRDAVRCWSGEGLPEPGTP